MNNTKKKNIQGLSKKEVEERKKRGLANGNFSVKTKSIGQIIYSNTFTLFNFINIFLASCLIMVHSYKNILFLGVVFWNILIGVVQEVRSKRVIDKLSLLSEPTVKVVREGKFCDIHIEELVLDDIFSLKNGNQVCTDAVIIEGECEINESLLTGESEPVYKKQGDEILSGSFLISGNVLAQAVHVGKDNYVSKITGQAKYLKKPNSEMLRSIKAIIKFISIALIPLACLLFFNQVRIDGNTFSEAVVSTVAAVIGMIPSGLVLLTSVVLAVSVIRLGQKHTLVQELYCIETLARVDTLCLDKTGTITEGVMDVEGVEILDKKFHAAQIDEMIYFFTNGLNDDNPTFQALKEYSGRLYNKKREVLETKVKDYQVRKKISFSSDKKWSLVDFEKQGTYVLGALEFIFREKNKELKEHALRFEKDGVRVLVLAHSKNHCDAGLPEGLKACAFVMLTDRIRKSAPETLRYFKNQGVNIKIISGDNPETVSNIAKRSGVLYPEKYVDASVLATDEDIKNASEEYTVFGRVTPMQKLKLVQALKEKGHTVAMTGDGVNDVMALKEADCSIAMQSGSDAARNVSQLVLMDSDFASMPDIVAEGRRTINNIQRSAALYLTKTIYSAMLVFIFIFLKAGYPFQPIQLTLLGSLAIGIPSFILAMEPNLNRVKGKFLMNVLKLAVPGGLIVITNVMAAEIFGWIFGIREKEIQTLAFFGLAIASLVELFKVCKPFNRLRVVMCTVIIFVFIVAAVFFGRFFEITSLSFASAVFTGIILITTPMLHKTYSIVTDKLLGNTPNVYDIYLACVRRKNSLENIVLVDEEVDKKDYMDVASQMMGLKVLKAQKIAYICKGCQQGDIRADYADRKKDESVLAAAAEFYVRKRVKKAERKDVMEVAVETIGSKLPVKVIVDLKNHRVIIENKEANGNLDDAKEEYICKARILKKIKLTL